MPTRSVVISEHEDALIEALVAAGKFRTADEVVRHGLGLVECEDQQGPEAKLERLRALIQEGEDAIARGDYVDLETPEEIEAFMRSLDEHV